MPGLTEMKYSELHGLCGIAIKKYPNKQHDIRKYARSILHEVLNYHVVAKGGTLGPDDPDFDLPPKIALRGHKLKAMMESDGNV